MSEAELKAIEVFIRKMSIPSDATDTERCLYAAVKGDMCKLAAEVRRLQRVIRADNGSS